MCPYLTCCQWAWIGKALVSAYLILVGLWDLRIERGKVPNWLTLPPLLVVGIMRFVPTRRIGGGWHMRAGWQACLVSWVIIILLWVLHVYGAGDAKFLMVQFGLFPTLRFATIMAICILLIQTPIQIMRRGFLQFGEETAFRLVTLNIFPTEEEFEAGKEPSTWLFVPAGVIYTWLFW